MPGKIPVTVLVITRNEAPRIARCLAALKDFDELIVVDSQSADETGALAAAAGAEVVCFRWNGQYPKKRQWCLDNLSLRNEYIFFVDADEEVTPELAREIAAAMAAPLPGYFVRGRYVMRGRKLRFGLHNNKLALFDRRRFSFPAVDDLGLAGMGEMEGHYQPVPGAAGTPMGQMKNPLLHHAEEGWDDRHRRYAAWEAGMNARSAWPPDPVPRRQGLKRLFRALPGRPLWAFVHCYVIKGGALDGRAGFRLAAGRFRYYRMIAAASKARA